MTQMNDWRLAFDVMAKYTDTGRTGRGAYDPTEYDDLNREFSRIFKERKNDLASLYGNAPGDPQIKNEDFTAAQNDCIGQRHKGVRWQPNASRNLRSSSISFRSGSSICSSGGQERWFELY